MKRRIVEAINRRHAYNSSERYIKYLRKKGIHIGEGCCFRFPKSVQIDTTRPSLVSIGSNVDINANFAIMTHDYSTSVFIHKYNDFINSSGKVEIGNNIYIGRNVTILKGVKIGDNCIIGVGSIVVKSISSNSVVVGCPGKVVSTLDDYYKKRQHHCIEEAFEYARSIQERFNRRPTIEDFWEEFPLFVNVDDIELPANISFKKQLGVALPEWKKTTVHDLRVVMTF